MKTFVPAVAGPFATEHEALRASFEFIFGKPDGHGFRRVDLDYTHRRFGDRWYVIQRPHADHAGNRRWRQAIRRWHMPKWRRRRCPQPMTAHEARMRRAIEAEA